MSTFPHAASLTEQLGSMVETVPDVVDVVQLTQPDVGTIQTRLRELVGRVADVAGLESARLSVETQSVQTVMRQPGQLTAVGFHDSGAMSVTLDVAPFDAIFDEDPGDDELTALSRRASEQLGLSKLVPPDDTLAFERLWRINAAASDRSGRTTEPVLCRAVGAFRHSVLELPVYGRASGTVQVAAGGQLISTSISTRRFAGDESGRIVAQAKTRAAGDAARDVVDQLGRSFGELRDASSMRIVPEWFRFGYLSLGRRRSQGLLAPFYIASIAIEHELEKSAHVIAVHGSTEQFVPLPAGRRSTAQARQPGRAATGAAA